MWDKLKEHATSVASGTVDEVAYVKESATQVAGKALKDQYQDQIDRTLSTMELAALKASQRNTIKEFEVSATLDIGIASISICANFDIDKIKKKLNDQVICQDVKEDG
jgi:hypothetical protein